MLTNSNAVMEWDRVVVYMYHLQNVSRKSSWKVKFTFGTWLFGSFQRKISRSNGTSVKVVLFSQSECSKWKFVFYFFIAIFDNSFRFSWPFFAKMELICTNGNANPEWNLLIYHEFCLLFGQTVNRPDCPCDSKQPTFSNFVPCI